MKLISVLSLLCAITAFTTSADSKMKTNALLDAVERGDVRTAGVLLKNGSNVNVRNSEGRTALHIAVIAGNTDMLKLILSRNPDVNAQDDTIGTTPLALAVSRKYTDGVRLILSHKPSLEKGTLTMPLPFIAMDSDDPEILTLLCDAGMSLSAIIDNYESANNVTCLMYAIVTGRNESVKFLLSHNADVNIPDSNGDPAIIWALFYDKTDIAKIMIDSGKKINYRTTGSGAPKGALDLAERKGFDDIANLIIKADGRSE